MEDDDQQMKELIDETAKMSMGKKKSSPMSHASVGLPYFIKLEVFETIAIFLLIHKGFSDET